ncbi:MAG: pyrroline-5-carboxylate reductase [Zetaproteobacteria bacterium]|nr:pyrroline-5-carboxylate reductase [Zetaproteobacteria bacterium]
MKPFSELKITFIGSGNMAEALVSGLVHAGHDAASLITTDVDAARLTMMHEMYGVHTLQENAKAVESADVVLLAVKPQKMAEVVPLLAHRIQSGATVISIAAGTSVKSLRGWLSTAGDALVRVMPNTPALVGEGMSVMYSDVQDAIHRERAEYVLSASGKTAWVESESHLHTVTALSGSGPAYIFLIAEIMETTAISAGLPAELARTLTAQTIVGSGKMLVESGRSPTDLKKQVTSPGGTTMAALDTMYEQGLPAAIRKGMAAAMKRSHELA